MKPLISYYGGKQKIIAHIIPLIPDHKIYIEPFFGGGTVFFRKPLAKVNIINDKNNWLINMYTQYQKNTKKFVKVLKALPFSERLNQISHKYKIKNELISACRLWYNITTSYANKIGGGFNGLVRDNRSTQFFNKLESLEQYIKKLQYCTIFCRNALELFDFYDGVDSFFYLDPPYPKTNQGHYKGYTMDDYYLLIDKLSGLKGKFILSNYQQQVKMPEHWIVKEIETLMTVVKKDGKYEKRTELLIMNFKPECDKSLFDIIEGVKE